MGGGSEADFMIHGIMKYHLFGQELWITTTTVGMTIITIVLLILAFAANGAMKHATEVPGTFQNILELGVEMLEKMTQGILGPSARRFANYIGTIFLFILFCNLSGLFGLRTVTADFGVTFLLGLVTFAIVQYQGIKNHGVGHFTGLFKPLPVLFPINVIGEFANPISISLRLFANMLSGVIILGLWYGMMPIFVKIGIPAALHVYCDLFSGCIQTYVFCMLTMVYVNDKLYKAHQRSLHDEYFWTGFYLWLLRHRCWTGNDRRYRTWCRTGYCRRLRLFCSGPQSGRKI